MSKKPKLLRIAEKNGILATSHFVRLERPQSTHLDFKGFHSQGEKALQGPGIFDNSTREGPN